MDPPLSSSPERYSSPPSPDLYRERSPQPPECPSPSYLEFTSIPSKTLSEPTPKLLVLDLNGTLVLRSPRPPKSSRGQYHQFQRPATRRVMRRPYLTALRAYLFAPQTQAWLDVIVWSSAQPHSVEDMVQHAFGEDRDRLVAIWARDTLGLTDNHYPPKSDRSPQQRATRSRHSAATTILLDDSHAKAARQPFNHLCVPEYTRAQRNADLAALQHARISSRVATQHGGTDGPIDTNGQAQVVQQQQHADADSAAAEKEESLLLVDETLLAVIGILHAARLQSSVAGWLRAGALVASAGCEGLEREQGAVWFEDAALVREWARRGREAMRALGLEVQHGVEP
ncbi:hypothetical protein BJV78DRAFT_1135588 [Lactifluus subvellereus]|nr:hypothetical protein BJV78DRAFT_1135588 [Lactifluus subvellereus]